MSQRAVQFIRISGRSDNRGRRRGAKKQASERIFPMPAGSCAKGVPALVPKFERLQAGAMILDALGQLLDRAMCRKFRRLI
jgi:hypothetical protein